MTDTPLVHLSAAEATIARANGHTVYTATELLCTSDWKTKVSPPVVTPPVVTPPSTGIVPVGFTGKYGALLFNQDFSKITTLDPTIWGKNWGGEGGVMNNVATYAANVSIANGQLELALAGSNSGALVHTMPGWINPGFEFTYGYIEASITFPGSGANVDNWPAFWTVCPAPLQTWPAGGEFDIAEGLGGAMTTNYHFTNVTDNSPPIPGNWGGTKHVYAMEWRAGVQNVYFDGVKVYSRTNNISTFPQCIIINNGGGSTPGTKVLVDYVRVWA